MAAVYGASAGFGVLQSGEQINEEVFQASALQTAVKNGGGWHDTRIISYLLDKGADVHFIQDDKGLRPQEIGCWPVLMYMARAVYVNATKLSFEYHPEETKDGANLFRRYTSYPLKDPRYADSYRLYCMILNPLANSIMY